VNMTTGTKTRGGSGRFLFWAALSIFSSVGIILVNKVIMKTYHFNFVFSLTSLHFIVQAIVLELLSRVGIIQSKPMPALDAVLTALCGVGSIAFMNYNLEFNSVGFYQMTKLLCVPLMVFIESNWYGKTFSGKVKFSLVLVLLGVGIACITDLEVNTVGTILGALAVLSTTQFQIWQGSKAAQHKMSSIQITHAVSLPLAVICSLCAFFVEMGVVSEKNVLEHQISGSDEIFLILLSCLLAISVNVCSFTLIGLGSAVTYQVIGHFKTALVLLGGLVLFPFQGSSLQLLNNIIGIIVAMFGVVLYGYAKESEKNQDPSRADWIDKNFPVVILQLIAFLENKRYTPVPQTDCSEHT